ncbi:hypothetical protein [Anthocerotibacter panamensis]|uniref:hypothetical protein n=1 Tax=Anthocerotibacter panamensis TaxID=2857077 RepID=UPI001C40240B|nr:hypothetical protein [Anthocerotibacter panamensis]
MSPKHPPLRSSILKVTAILLHTLLLGRALSLPVHAGWSPTEQFGAPSTLLLAKGPKKDKEFRGRVENDDFDDEDRFDDRRDIQLRNQRFDDSQRDSFRRCFDTRLRSLPRGIDDNNRTIRLAEGSYRGNQTIDGNRVRIVGVNDGLRDRCATAIDGSLVIRGNSVLLSDLIVRGDVLVLGNNTSLRNVLIQGNLRTRGNNFNRQNVLADPNFSRTFSRDFGFDNSNSGFDPRFDSRFDPRVQSFPGNGFPGNPLDGNSLPVWFLYLLLQNQGR